MTHAETIRRLKLVHRWGSCRNIDARLELRRQKFIDYAMSDGAHSCPNGIPHFRLTDKGRAMIGLRP